MEMYVRYRALPDGFTAERLKLELAELLDDEGWLTGSGESSAGSYIELELEDERANPKHSILAVKHFLQNAGFSPETALELSGVPVGIYE